MAIVVGLLMLDAYRAVRDDGSTFSEAVRVVFRTDTPAGRLVFLTGLNAFAKHILK